MPHSLSDYHERELMTLVSLILDRGLAVDFDCADTGRTLLRACNDLHLILAELGKRGDDVLSVVRRDRDGVQHIGAILLVYGNQPGELIADHSVTGELEGIAAAFERAHPTEPDFHSPG